jgi:hypothetical protein
VPQWLDDALDRIRRDLAGPWPDWELLAEPYPDDDGWYRLTYDGSCTVRLDDDCEPSVITLLAEVTDNLWPMDDTRPWPPCPEHLDSPLYPQLHDGHAVWKCHRGAPIVVPVGSLVTDPAWGQGSPVGGDAGIGADDGRFWRSPEAAAAGSFSPAASAKVIGVKWRTLGEDATVHITVGPDYDYYVHVVREPGGWVEMDSGN